jgi:hypothetical protein
VKRLLPLLFLAAPALAQETFTEVGGRLYTLDPLDGGAVLVSPSPAPAEEVTLMGDCRAFHPDAGDGSWAWDAGGFSVMFAETELRFEGQRPPFDAPACGG